MVGGLVAVLCGVVFRRDDQTAALASTSVHRLDDVNHFLLVLQWPVDFVIVSRPQIDHDVFVAEEEHDCARVVQFIPGKMEGWCRSWVWAQGRLFNVGDLHFVEIRNRCNVH